MKELKQYLFDAICDFLDEVVQADYEQTEEFQTLRRCVDENDAKICELTADKPELLALIRKREDLLLNLQTGRETQNIKALIKKIYR